MSELQLPELKEVDIDYITATSPERDFASALGAFGAWLVSQEVEEGSERRSYRAQGYRGFIAGRAAVGVSPQGTIVRLSSKCAAEYWEQLLGFARNVTRLDVQLTVRQADSPSQQIGLHHSQLKAAPRFRGKPAIFLVRYGPQGGESADIGSRKSDRWGRIYDKGLESGDPEYDGCLRYEEQLQNEAAFRAAQYFDSIEDKQIAMYAEVCSFFLSRGLRAGYLRSDLGASNFPSIRLRCQAMPDDGRCDNKELRQRLSWLRYQVAPTVERLLSHGCRDEVLEALGLSK